MTSSLIFEAAVNGIVFGVVLVEDGVAKARAGDMILKNVLLGHALMWVREHCPDPYGHVQFRLASLSKAVEAGRPDSVSRTFNQACGRVAS